MQYCYCYVAKQLSCLQALTTAWQHAASSAVWASNKHSRAQPAPVKQLCSCYDTWLPAGAAG